MISVREVNDNTNNVVKAVEAEIEDRMMKGRTMSFMDVLAFAAGYSGHRPIDYGRLFKAFEELADMDVISYK